MDKTDKILTRCQLLVVRSDESLEKGGGLGSFLKQVALKVGFSGFGKTKTEKVSWGPGYADTGLSVKDFHGQGGPPERSLS